MRFKQLQWGTSSSLFPGMFYVQSTDPGPFTDITLFLELRGIDHQWNVSFTEESHWGTYWTPLTLDPHYTLDEVKTFAQAGWEHYIRTNFFEEELNA